MSRYDRPGTDEYAPFYHGYVAGLPEGDVLDILARQRDETTALFSTASADRWHFRYAPGKWSVAEVLGHLCDAERIMSYRALRFGRGDHTPVPGFEENDYVPTGRFDERRPDGLIAEYQTVRQATIALFTHLPDDAPARRGVANGAEVSVRALIHIIAGHERHHLGILRERYGLVE
jgi:uncharacterized damage-inducible protein DinB